MLLVRHVYKIIAHFIDINHNWWLIDVKRVKKVYIVRQN